MPTHNPRINVTLSPGLDSLVSRLAAHQRASKSQVLRELLEASEPALQRVVALMDAGAQASAALKGRLASTIGDAARTAEGELSTLLKVIEAGSVDLVGQAEAIQGRRPGRAEGGARRTPMGGPGGAAVGVQPRSRQENPPASNRGVKSLSATRRGSQK